MKRDSSDVYERLKKYLPAYLLTTEKSRAGNELVSSLLRAYKIGKGIRLCGDPYFRQLIKRLSDTLSFKAIFEDEDPEQDFSRIYVPGPKERTDDLPRIISYMVNDIAESLSKRSVQIPRYICGRTINFLLFYPEWNDFRQIYNYLQKCLAETWMNDTITLSTSLEIAVDDFVNQTPFSEDIFPSTPTRNEREFMGEDKRTDREKTLSAVRDCYWHRPTESGCSPYTAFYLCAEPGVIDDDQSIAHRFGLASIMQVMENVLSIERIPPQYEGGEMVLPADIDKFVRARSELSGAIQMTRENKFMQKQQEIQKEIFRLQEKIEELRADFVRHKDKYPIRLTDDEKSRIEKLNSEIKEWENQLKRLGQTKTQDQKDNVWHGWSRKDEARLMKNEYGWNLRTYDKKAAACHFNLYFPNPDDVHGKQREARKRLLYMGAVYYLDDFSKVWTYRELHEPNDLELILIKKLRDAPAEGITWRDMMSAIEDEHPDYFERKDAANSFADFRKKDRPGGRMFLGIAVSAGPRRWKFNQDAKKTDTPIPVPEVF